VVDGVAAVVDGHVITRSEVEELLNVQGRTESQASGSDKARALDSLIEEALVAREADRLGIRVTDEDVDRTVESIRARNNLDEEAFQAAVASRRISYTAYLEEVRSQIRRAKVAQRVLRSRMRVGDEALREYYLKNVADFQEPEKVRICHIQLPASEGREKAEAVRQKALAGADFSVLARQVSEGPSAAQGGDMGFLSVKNLSEEVRKAVADLPDGGISPVVEMAGACHIFAVLEKQDGRIPDFEEVRDEIQDLYFKEKEQELYRTWIESLREGARIDRKL
jgi:peptidyl-prolyl cis-trans isomerase SurA